MRFAFISVLLRVFVSLLLSGLVSTCGVYLGLGNWVENPYVWLGSGGVLFVISFAIFPYGWWCDGRPKTHDKLNG